MTPGSPAPSPGRRCWRSSKRTALRPSSVTMRRSCEVWQLGRLPYAQALELQNRLAHEPGVDRLLLLEHPPTYTLGSSARDEHLLMPEDERQRLGIEVFRVDRGGDITYHGPGQLVGYP